MNILYITPDFNFCCGRSKYVYLLAKYFSKRQHNILLLTNGGDSLERIKKIDVRYMLSKFVKGNNPYHIIAAIKELHKIVKENNIDLIHCHHRYNDIVISFYKKLFNNNIRTITTVLSITTGMKMISYKADLLIAVSKSVKKHLINNFNINDEKIITVNHFVEPLPEDEDLHIHKSNNNVIRILGVGRFNHEKNFSVLIEACSKIRNTRIQLTLVGDGEDKDRYQKEAVEKGCNLQIIDTIKDLSFYYKNSDICVLPSTVDPFPHFMLESGLYAKPFIGSDIGGINELIINGHNGLCFEVNNSEELKSKIELLIKDVNLRHIIGKNLREEIMQKYLPKNIIAQIEKIYYSQIKYRN